ncbi:hypothetical protein FPV67DRAFT_1445813 [Lyophyllum atratum]|nr:hypothetical protein FPV67DRAFT_1445813 [Lyophyllum atratum]
MAVGRMWWPSCAGAVVVWLGVWDGAAGVRCRAVVRDVVGGLLGWLWLLAVTVVGGVVLVTWGWASVVLGVRACPHFGRARVTWRCWWWAATVVVVVEEQTTTNMMLMFQPSCDLAHGPVVEHNE